MRSKVLLVDDSVTVLQIVSAALEREGIETLEATDGDDALRKLARNPDVALVLCDINMPRMNGIDFVANARKAGSNVPFVMLTTEGDPDLMARAKALGVKGWLLKPIKAPRLVAVVKAMIASKAPAGEAPMRSTTPPRGGSRI